MFIGIHSKYPLFFSDCNETLKFPTDFRKILKYKILLKFFQWKPSYSMRTDRHGEAFRNLANAPIKTWLYRVNPFLLLHCKSCPQKRNEKLSH